MACNEEPKDKGIPKDAVFFIPLPKPPHTSGHYKGFVIEPIDLIEMWDLNFFEGCVLKYLFRSRVGKSKTPEKDLEKLVVYAEWLLKIFRRDRHARASS